MDTIIFLEECQSTNTFLMNQLCRGLTLPKLFTVATRYQSQGRGQRGNSWLSEPGKNLTISILLKPDTLKITNQFYISELSAIAVFRTIMHYLTSQEKKHLRVKWPNDIYYNDKKIAGILIENSILGEVIQFSVVGIGLNINQIEFSSELPNAISLANITRKFYNLKEVLQVLHDKFEDMYDDFLLGNYSFVHNQYMEFLYRKNGYHKFRDSSGQFSARILDVKPSGHIVLEKEDGSSCFYAFKEVVFDVD